MNAELTSRADFITHSKTEENDEETSNDASKSHVKRYHEKMNRSDNVVEDTDRIVHKPRHQKVPVTLKKLSFSDSIRWPIMEKAERDTISSNWLHSYRTYILDSFD